MRILLRSFAAIALCIFAGGCSVCDWCYDLCYGNKPVPTTPIVPPADPAPYEFYAADAIAAMTDSLIFTLSGLSEKGKPVVSFAGGSREQALGNAVYLELIRSRTISLPVIQGAARTDYVLHSDTPGNNMWNVILEKADHSSTVFNRTLKLKPAARERSDK